MDEIEQSKAALKEIHEFFKANIQNGTFQNEGFTDGLSEQYNFMDFSVVVSLNEITGRPEQYTYYNGDDEFAEVYSDNSSNLDNEFMDEIDKVLEVHEDFRRNLKINNQENRKTRTKTRKI